MAFYGKHVVCICKYHLQSSVQSGRWNRKISKVEAGLWVSTTHWRKGVDSWVLRLTGCGRQKTSQFGSFFIGLGCVLPLRLLKRACLPALFWPMGQQPTWSLCPSLPNSQVSPAPSLKCMQVAQPLGSSQYVKYMSWDHPELAKEIISYMYQDLPVIGLWLTDG